MIWRLYQKALQATVLAAAILVSPMASAVEEATRALAEQLEVVDGLTKLGDDLKAVITTDLGFTDAQIERWHDAVDAAFAVNLLEADSLEALESVTTEDTRQAALAYERSDLAVEVGEQVETLFLEEGAEALVEAGQSYLESASASENALLVDLFAAQRSPERADLEMDIYFRAMAIMAAPITGPEVAEEWVESAQYLREDYSRDNLLLRIGAYSTVPEAQLVEVVEKLNDPLLVAFSSQLVTALSETMHAATDRIETEYD
ncbi:MAG: hypothetical protein P0Y65_14690 [Candidatus Devosia phytovorans]|uniref:DUF2059 domain-containing protein n=1 Tax=Candidatus Devosia phytovorans TaxID=3121372 RepID=A0AAJ5VT50_9HYPH|nr:hypothetical protein [Devosia sp.]WEK03435.1 MAG: hypothetical protein P0Y65_14690 [Devosia sp.]